MKKRIVALFLCVCLMVNLCGCKLIEDFGVLEVFEQLKSEFIELFSPYGEVIEVSIEEFDVVSPEFNVCYNTLNKKQKELYKLLYAIVEQMPEGFVRLTENYDGFSADIHIAYTALLYDRAEIFWMPITYLVGEVKSFGKTYATIAFDYENETNRVEYKVSKDERDSMRKELEETVNALTSQADAYESEYEKELFFNNYICANTEYDTEAKLASTSYGCLVLKRALCEGYSRAFKLLCNKSGISCDLISGESDGEGHMWNIVNIDGIMSYADVTWNDSQEGLEYFYFNITENQLLDDHIIAPVYSEIDGSKLSLGTPFNYFKQGCTYRGNSYYHKNGLLLDYDYSNKAAKIIREDSLKGKNYSYFAFDSEAVLEKFKSDSDSFLDSIQRQIGKITINSYIFKRDVLVVFYK